MPDFTDDEKRLEALREVTRRKSFYAMIARQADQIEDRRIAIMQEIAADYHERTQPNLFG